MTEELIPPSDGPPGKLEFEGLVYGWFKHVHDEIDELLVALAQPAPAEALREKLEHVNLSFEEALRELDLYVPEEIREAVTARAAARKEAMAAYPLPPFPAHPPGESAGGVGTEHLEEHGTWEP